MKYIHLLDRPDRLGSNLAWYISTILIAVKHNYKIKLIKPKKDYRYSYSIFVEILFIFIDDYNSSLVEDEMVVESEEFFYKIMNCLLDIKCDFVTAFKNIFTEKYKIKLLELAKQKKYVPFENTIVVHLRLDDRSNWFTTLNERLKCCGVFKSLLDSNKNIFPGYLGQLAMKEEEIQIVINKALSIYKNYEVVIVTNGLHNLPYKTITNVDESYDLFLLSTSNVLIGSMSTFSFSALYFGNHEKIYYPLWDHAVCFGLTTIYDHTTIDLF